MNPADLQTCSPTVGPGTSRSRKGGARFAGIHKGHDASVCLLTHRQGKLDIEILLKERFTRVKRDSGEFTALPERVRQDLASSRAVGWNNWGDYWPVRSQIPEVQWVPHHYAHAAAAACLSPFERSLIVVLDGQGSCATAFSPEGEELRQFPVPEGGLAFESFTAFTQDGARLKCVDKEWQRVFKSSNSMDGVGYFYAEMAKHIFNSGWESGKVMGLAPFGRARPIQDRMQFVQSLDPELRFSGHGKHPWEASGRFAHYADLAATSQEYFEGYLLEKLSVLKRRHPDRNDLILTGGCALNCVANMKVVQSGLFSKVYVHPFPSDESISLGLAAYLADQHGIPWRPRSWSDQRADFGSRTSVPGPDEVERAFRGRKILKPARLDEGVAELLDAGAIVGWFQGRSESGPRALGQRSILAKPGLKGVRDLLNDRIKLRESFRPYGGAVLWEFAADYFEVESGFDGPFMSFAPRVRSPYHEPLAGILHVDGSSRIQTVRQSQNPQFHALISAIGRRTGVYCVLNTSMNIMGQPIVETVDQAVEFFERVPVDAMVVENRVILRDPQEGGIQPPSAFGKGLP